MDIQIDSTTRQILAYGTFPTPSSDPNVLTLSLDESQVPLLSEPGMKTLEEDGRITVTPPAPAPDPVPDPRKQIAIDEMIQGYHNLAGSGDAALAATAPILLRQSMVLAQLAGFPVDPATDFPQDLQEALATLQQ